MWQELIEILQKITGYYQQLLDLSRQKRVILVTVKLEELDGIVQQEQKLADLVQKAEKQRQQILQQLAAERKEIQPNTRMQDLEGYCPTEEIASRLLRVHVALDDIITKVKEAGENNKILISGALSAVNYRLNQLGNTAVDPSYGAKGQEVVSRQKKFDFRA